jgi:glucose-1-phosphate adenylyltransferase
VLGVDVIVGQGSYVDGSVLLNGARVGRNAVVRRAILDKNVVVPDGAQIGVDLRADAEKYTVSEGGVVVIGKGTRVE